MTDMKFISNVFFCFLLTDCLFMNFKIGIVKNLIKQYA